MLFLVCLYFLIFILESSLKYLVTPALCTQRACQQFSQGDSAGSFPGGSPLPPLPTSSSSLGLFGFSRKDYAKLCMEDKSWEPSRKMRLSLMFRSLLLTLSAVPGVSWSRDPLILLLPIKMPPVLPAWRRDSGPWIKREKRMGSSNWFLNRLPTYSPLQLQLTLISKGRGAPFLTFSQIPQFLPNSAFVTFMIHFSPLNLLLVPQISLLLSPCLLLLSLWAYIFFFFFKSFQGHFGGAARRDLNMHSVCHCRESQFLFL
jgi:hypothetical protein